MTTWPSETFRLILALSASAGVPRMGGTGRKIAGGRLTCQAPPATGQSRRRARAGASTRPSTAGRCCGCQHTCAGRKQHHDGATNCFCGANISS